MSSEKLVERSDADGVVTLTLNRPDKLNALTVGVFRELRAHVEALRGDKTARCVVLRGAGKCFSAGHDLADIAEGEAVPSRGWHSETLRLMEKLPQPVIAAVHGHCYTGALEVALACDFIVAADNARFGDTHAKWALTPIWGMSQRLPRRVGFAKAREMMFTARTYGADEAVAMGLANTAVADEDFDAELGRLAKSILANSWFSHRANKRLLMQTEGMTLAAGLSCEIHRTEGRGPDMQERIAAFMNKTSKVS